MAAHLLVDPERSASGFTAPNRHPSTEPYNKADITHRVRDIRLVPTAELGESH